jgi:transcriptional regulator with XRE-family HTH domain
MAEYDAAELAFELGAALRRLREERGLSQSSLAVAARTTQPVVARLEAGGAVPTVAVLQRLARGLELRLEVGFREVPDPAQHPHRQRLAVLRTAAGEGTTEVGEVSFPMTTNETA